MKDHDFSQSICHTMSSTCQTDFSENHNLNFRGLDNLLGY